MIRLLLFFILFNSLYSQIPIYNPAVLSSDGATYVLQNDINATGTAFSITGDNITLDLNRHTINYCIENSSTSFGIEIVGLRSNITVKNGTIIKGAGIGENSDGIYNNTTSSNFLFSKLIIKTNGINSIPINITCNHSVVEFCYLSNMSKGSNLDGDGLESIKIDARAASMIVKNNILVNGHRGISCYFWGLSEESPDSSYIYNNYIQHARRLAGLKAPYGILLGKCRHVEIYDNQIISDNGRGINIDGFGQGVSRGSDYNYIHNNDIDVKYTLEADTGGYVENNVYGIRNRYSSGNNTYRNNTIIVDNNKFGYSYGIFVGSDATDRLMTNILINKNIVIARGNTTVIRDIPTCFYNEYINDIEITDNKYKYDSGGIDEQHANVGEFKYANNVLLNPTSTTPKSPTGIKIIKFLNDYSLFWNRNIEEDVFEYIVYKDDKKIPISARGGTFYIDTDVKGIHKYFITAINLKGVESSPSLTVYTNDATDGWWGRGEVHEPLRLKISR